MNEAPQQTFYVRVTSNETLIVAGSKARFSDSVPLRFHFESATGPQDPEVQESGANEWKSTAPVWIGGDSYDMSISFSSGSNRSYLYGIFTAVTAAAGSSGRLRSRAGDPIGVWGSDDEPPPKDEEES